MKTWLDQRFLKASPRCPVGADGCCVLAYLLATSTPQTRFCSRRGLLFSLSLSLSLFSRRLSVFSPMLRLSHPSHAPDPLPTTFRLRHRSYHSAKSLLQVRDLIGNSRFLGLAVSGFDASRITVAAAPAAPSANVGEAATEAIARTASSACTQGTSPRSPPRAR